MRFTSAPRMVRGVLNSAKGAYMFIGHLPMGYVCTRGALRATSASGAERRILIGAGLLGSILPDADMFYFYLIDKQQHLHHHYLTHTPGFWLAVLLVCLVVARRSHHPWAWKAVVFFGANIMLHHLLDTIGGGIRWLYPISTRTFTMIEVPARYDWWVWNFVFHWTFGLEILAILCAAFLVMSARRSAARQKAMPHSA